MTQRLTRRRFIQRTSAAAAAAAVLPTVVSRNVLGANERLNIAAIGAGGKGAVDIDLCSSQNIVAMCDVDQRNAASMFKRFTSAPKYADFRVMLDKEEKHIDAVTVSTPDHLHAVAGMRVMKMGKHLYCQKPLTHDIWESRQMTHMARQMKVVTQMGNQGHSHPDTRRLVELIHAGVLGKVSAVHVWTDRPIWPQGIDRPSDTPTVPSTLAWDLWLGPAPYRPFHPAYVPFKWRGWWDFGTGALGDMACHNMDLPFFSLGLRDPVRVEVESSPVNQETAPKWSIITYHFPARGDRPAVALTWYDGGKKPSADLVKGQALPGNGVIMVGDKDTLFVPSYWGAGSFLSGKSMDDYKSVPQSLPRMANSADNDRAHHLEWIEACKANDPSKALSNFDYAGPMAESVLLGNVALRAGQTIEWDAHNLKVTNLPEANRYVRREYRKGWAL